MTKRQLTSQLADESPLACCLLTVGALEPGHAARRRAAMAVAATDWLGRDGKRVFPHPQPHNILRAAPAAGCV